MEDFGELMDGGVYDMIDRVMDDGAILDFMGEVTILSTLIPLIIALIGVYRFYQEANDSLTGKAALAEAVGSVSRVVIMLLIYSGAGVVLFQLLWHITGIFEEFGSLQSIHTDLYESRMTLMSSAEVQQSWWEAALNQVIGVVNFLNLGVVYVIYTLVSVPYVFIINLLDCAYSLILVSTFAWGYIAIGTMGLKNNRSLMEGFIRTIYFLIAWAFFEAIFLGMLSVISDNSSKMVIDYFANSADSTKALMWHIYALLIMAMVVIFEILAIRMAANFANNQAAGGDIGLIVGGLAAIAANNAARTASESGGKILGNSMPESGGERTRDAIANTASSTVGDAAKSTKEGMGNLINSILNKGDNN